MNWFTDKLYDLAASSRGGEGAWSELAAQDKMSPATRASYYVGSDMPKDPRIAGWRSQPRMGDVVAMPGTADWMTPPTAQSWEAEHRYAPQGKEISQGDAFWMGGGRPLPQRSEADAYRMGGLAAMDQYKPNTFREIDRADIEDRYGGADLHGIELPPVSKDEPRAWFDAVVPQSPLDVGLMAVGPAGRIAGKGAAALTGVAGVMGELVDPAEAGVLGKAGGLLRGKPGGPWEGGIRAYHSSPHDFDKFDWSKLRTGEGANTYGAGFYAAENPAVSGQGGEYWKAFANRFGGSEGNAAKLLAEHAFDREKALKTLADKIERAKAEPTTNMYGPTAKQSHIDLLLGQQRRLESGAPVGPRTYEVNIAARPELMLDWDKGMSAQPKFIQEYAKEIPRGTNDPVFGNVPFADPTGEEVYKRLARQAVPEKFLLDYGARSEGQQIASQQLAEAGIPGIRYLDQGSRRGAGGMTSAGMTLAEPPKTYNYVVTDPSKLDILAKYGVVGTAGGGMAALAAQDRYGDVP